MFEHYSVKGAALAAIALLVFGIETVLSSDEIHNESIEQKLIRTCNPLKGRLSFKKHTSGQDYLLYKTLDEVRSIIQYQIENPHLCPPQYKESFDKLLPIVSGELTDDICSPNTYQLIRAYHLEFIHFYAREISTDELNFKRKLPATRGRTGEETTALATKPIPEPLRRFFILLAKQINGLCKLNINTRLAQLVDENVKRELDEFELIKKSVRKNLGSKTLSQAESNKSVGKLKLKEITMVDYLGSHLYITVPQGNPIRRLHKLCLNHFRPIYLEVFETVIRLNSLGYRDHVISSAHERNELDGKRDVTVWYDLIQVCEMMKDIEIVDSAVKSSRQDQIWFAEPEQDVAQPQQWALQLHSMRLVVPHVPLHFGQTIQISNAKLAKEEVKKFEQFVRWAVRERTSLLSQARRDIKSFFTRQFNKLKEKSIELRDKYVTFIHNHSVTLVVGLTIMVVIMAVTLIFIAAAGVSVG